MDLRVDEAGMKAVIAKAILDTLTPEAREQLITNAIKETLTVPQSSGGYGRKERSPLQQAFDSAVYDAANRFAAQTLTNDPAFNEQLKGLFADVANKLFASETREELVSAIASTIRSALAKDRY